MRAWVGMDLRPMVGIWGVGGCVGGGTILRIRFGLGKRYTQSYDWSCKSERTPGRITGNYSRRQALGTEVLLAV